MCVVGFIPTLRLAAQLSVDAVAGMQDHGTPHCPWLLEVPGPKFEHVHVVLISCLTSKHTQIAFKGGTSWETRDVRELVRLSFLCNKQPQCRALCGVFLYVTQNQCMDLN